jgi:hypothetical protein
METVSEASYPTWGQASGQAAATVTGTSTSQCGGEVSDCTGCVLGSSERTHSLTMREHPTQEGAVTLPSMEGLLKPGRIVHSSLGTLGTMRS